MSVAGSTASTRSSAHSFISRKARSARRCTVAPIPNTRSSPRPPMCHRRSGVSWCAPDALETASDDHANPAEPRSFAVEPERPVVARTETSVASVTASRAAPLAYVPASPCPATVESCRETISRRRPTTVDFRQRRQTKNEGSFRRVIAVSSASKIASGRAVNTGIRTISSLDEKVTEKDRNEAPTPRRALLDDELYAAALAERHVLTRPPLTTLPPRSSSHPPTLAPTSSTRIPADHAASSRASRRPALTLPPLLSLGSLPAAATPRSLRPRARSSTPRVARHPSSHPFPRPSPCPSQGACPRPPAVRVADARMRRPRRRGRASAPAARVLHAAVGVRDASAPCRARAALSDRFFPMSHARARPDSSAEGSLPLRSRL